MIKTLIGCTIKYSTAMYICFYLNKVLQGHLVDTPLLHHVPALHLNLEKDNCLHSINITPRTCT